MTQSELVSIVIVSYNNWPEIELAVQSALCQSYRPIEVIVVDNTSTDGSWIELQKRFGNRIRCMQQPNTGDAGAYNTGFRQAQGDFVQFMDGDDVLAPHKIEKQMEVFGAKPDSDVVYGDTRCFQERPGRAVLDDTDTGNETDLLATLLRACGDYFGNTLGLLFRRKAIQLVGPWDEVVYITDADYFMRSLWSGCRFEYCPQALMGFVSKGPGRMGSDILKMHRGHEALWTKALSYITTEPYRSMVQTNLARVQFVRAITQRGMSRREALAKLHHSRQTKKAEVNLLTYAIAFLTIILPFGNHVATSPHLRLLRRSLGRLAGYRPPGFGVNRPESPRPASAAMHRYDLAE